MVYWLVFTGCCLFSIFGICFMSVVIDVREDRKWDRELKKEAKSLKEYRNLGSKSVVNSGKKCEVTSEK